MVVYKMTLRVKNALLHKLGFVQPPYFYTPWPGCMETYDVPVQWRRLHGAREGARASTFTSNGWARGGTVSRTANKKLTKLYWSSRKRSPKRLIYPLAPKSGEARQKNFRRF